MSNDLNFVRACKEIGWELVKRRVRNRVEVSKVKAEISRKYGLKSIPSNPDILRNFDGDRELLRRLLMLKPSRSISGIVILSVMTEPFDCPHGRCSYCPRFPGAPVSYTGREPAAMRAIENEFDPYKQIKNRLIQLSEMGHSVEKIELIIQGGTFNTTPEWYREHFLKRVLEAVTSHRASNYEELMLAAERSAFRLVGMTIETRPDQLSKSQIDWILEKGFTRVEVGVQALYDSIYERTNRGHKVMDVIEATRRLKDAGLKVCYHMMPGLPGVNELIDLDMFRTLIENENFRPDMLKIYPTLVLEGTKLYEEWRDGKYKPYNTLRAAKLIELIKANFIPKWVRIMRVQRDIPADEIIDGVKKGNLREIIQSLLEKHGLKCKCIRCREIGRKKLKGLISKRVRVELMVEAYPASKGVEFFISAEDVENDCLIGFLRLRKPSGREWREELTSMKTFIIRELHVYDEALPLGVRLEESFQHRGIGSMLLKKAEEVAVEKGAEKIAVLSGIGAREYYYKHGYFRDGPYVSKIIK